MILRRNMRVPHGQSATGFPEYTWGRTMDALDAQFLKYYLQLLAKAKLLRLRHVECTRKMDLGENDRSFNYAIDRARHGDN